MPHEAATAILEALFQDFTLPPGAATLIPALADPRSQEGLAKVLEPYRPAGEYWHVVLASPEEAQQAAQISGGWAGGWVGCSSLRSLGWWVPYSVLSRQKQNAAKAFDLILGPGGIQFNSWLFEGVEPWNCGKALKIFCFVRIFGDESAVLVQKWLEFCLKTVDIMCDMVK